MNENSGLIAISSAKVFCNLQLEANVIQLRNKELQIYFSNKVKLKHCEKWKEQKEQTSSYWSGNKDPHTLPAVDDQMTCTQWCLL